MLKTDNKYTDAFQSLKKYQTFIALTVIFISAILLLRSAFYGIATPDESFYLTIPYRLIRGDALIVDEWHASQFSAALLYLPMKLFLLITGSTDGMVLYFRCLFVACQTAVSYFTFYKIRKYGTAAALVSAILYLLYVPETVKMLDYYTMSLMGFQVVALILFCTEKLRWYHLYFSGAVFACAVLAQPFNCLIYFLYSIAFVIALFMKKRKQFSDKAEAFFSWKSWLCLTAGIVTIAVVFLAFLFSQLTIEEFFANFSNVFGGQDHTLPFADTGETDMFSYITIFSTLYKYCPRGFILSLLLIAALCVDRDRVRRRQIWIYATFAVVVLMVIELGVSITDTICSTLFRPYVAFIFSFACLRLTEKKQKELGAVWLTGVAYIICLGLISQALDYVGVIGCVISNTVFMPSFLQLCREVRSEKTEDVRNKKQNKSVLRALAVSCAFVLVFDITAGTVLNLMNDTTAKEMGRDSVAQTVVIDNGPLKGIRTDEKIYNNYQAIIADTEIIKDNSCNSVLVAGLIPWVYFCFDGPPATFTTWYIDGELNLYDDYYGGNKDKIPDCIYIPSTSFYWDVSSKTLADEYDGFFSGMFNETQQKGSAGYILYIEK